MNTTIFRPLFSAIDSSTSLAQLFTLALFIESYTIIEFDTSIMDANMSITNLGIKPVLVLIFLLVAFKMIWGGIFLLKTFAPALQSDSEVQPRTSFTGLILFAASLTYLIATHYNPSSLPIPQDTIWENIYNAIITYAATGGLVIALIPMIKLDDDA